MPDFIPGLELARAFYAEAVRPLLEHRFPGLRHSAALLGSGSEVLGFDTPMSTDHDWGPRVQLFLEEDDFAHRREIIEEALRQGLPHTFRGFSTSFAPPDPQDHGTRLPMPREEGPVSHKVELLTLRGFLRDYLGCDLREEPAVSDWLTFPEQKLRAIIAGAVYHDDIGLQVMRDRFAYYPPDVWLYLLAAAWNRIGQEEHLMGRAGQAGDEIGSALIAARLVRDLMRLCFLMERQYAPYPKWFGTAFARLSCAPALAPTLQRVLQAPTWTEREESLVESYEHVAVMHNALGLTEPRPTQATPFFGRPFRVVHLHGGYADAIRARIRDPEVRRIAERPLIGGIDLFSDNIDLLCDPGYRKALRGLFTEGDAAKDIRDGDLANE